MKTPRFESLKRVDEAFFFCVFYIHDSAVKFFEKAVYRSYTYESDVDVYVHVQCMLHCTSISFVIFNLCSFDLARIELSLG